MKLIPNFGAQRVIDELRACLADGARLDVASSAFSLFAFAELREFLERIDRCRLVLPAHQGSDLRLLGEDADRPVRNRLLAPWLARQCIDWLDRKVDMRTLPTPVPQGLMLAQDGQGSQ